MENNPIYLQIQYPSIPVEDNNADLMYLQPHYFRQLYVELCCLLRFKYPATLIEQFSYWRNV